MELVDGTDLGRWMERSRDGRREYGQGYAARVGAAPASGSGGGGAGERLRQNPSYDCERGRTT